MRFQQSLVATLLLTGLVACSSDSDYDFEGSQAELQAEVIANSPPQALFNPDSTSESFALPSPNSLAFVGSTDGTLNISVAADDVQTLANPVVAMNQLDGFSTVAPISAEVSEPLDPASLVLGDSIRVYEVSTVQAVAVTGVTAEISNPLQLAVTTTGNQIVILPVSPLKPKTDYLVVLTNGIQDLSGDALEPSLIYETMKGETAFTNADREMLRQATRSQVAAASAFSSISADDIALSWVFRTQSIRDVMQAVHDQSASSTLTMGASGLTTAAITGLSGKADIYVGNLDIPYYLTAVGGSSTALDALGSYWRNASDNVVGAINSSGVADYAPVATSTQTIPVLMTVPNADSATGGIMPANGWPVTIFQHGVTRQRTDMLAIADAMADAGRAVIAIDMPMHGITDSTSPFHADNFALLDHERTFGIDLMTNPLEDGTEVENTGPDGLADPSGQYFINLQNLANARDNLRQAAADLFVLRASLGSALVDGVQLDAANVSFVGHSLGAIVGTTVLSYDSNYTAATLAVPGGGIAQLLANSETFGPIIEDGLANAGVQAGTSDFAAFMVAAQSLVDSGDPINHASYLAASASTPLHLIEVIGDAVIPNSVATAPLSGTAPLARMLNLQQISGNSTSGGYVRFTQGDHGSIIDPSSSLAATVEMQTEMATFAASLGTLLPVSTDSGVVETVD